MSAAVSPTVAPGPGVSPLAVPLPALPPLAGVRMAAAAAGIRYKGRTDLVMIEVQSGEYLGEDDIVRFEDIYGRTQ